MFIEEEISSFMLRASKFEFFLISENIELANIVKENNQQKVIGICWHGVAALLEEKVPFKNYPFEKSDFSFLKERSPQYLVKNENGGVKWDGVEIVVDSWLLLLVKSYAQLRNNVAHGNKALMDAPFTKGDTEKFIKSANALMDFIADKVFSVRDWCKNIEFAH